jgi:hypothetical protein
MGRLRLNALWSAVAIFSLLSLSLSGCGGTKAGAPIFPGRVSLSPATTSSLVLGATLNFTASAQTVSGTNIATPISFTSSNTSILTLAPNGVACAGQWDVNFTACTPGNSGPVTVTASALGANSVPVYVFVHPPIDSVTVNGVQLNGLPVQEPCLSQTQSMTVEAHAFSQGTDITASVGPFIFSATSTSVVNLVPLVNNAYNFATNQATAIALSPGMTQIFASASGVSSTTFQQPQYQNSLGATSPALDFFETCPIQSIALEIETGTQQSAQTTFVTEKGTGQTATAVLTDVMGNSSLPNTNGGIVLSKVPLTWISSQPGVLSTPNGCMESCALTTPAPGSGSVTASCSPPTCNIGFPLVPTSLSTANQIDTCTQFFQAQYPKFLGCLQLIPAPVYADPLPASFDAQVPGGGWISGVVTGAPVAATILATSTGCAANSPATCVASMYSLSTAKASTGPENPIPTTPNSLLLDPAGDKAYMGSDFGAQLVTPANFGGTTSPFISLGTITGTVLAVSNNGTLAVFSDVLHTPNQVFIVNTSNATAATATALNISGAVAAAFSPDGLKTFIIGCVASSIPCSSTTGNALYVFSPLQALQGPIALAGSANSVVFSPNGAFAYVAESSTSTTSANLSAFATCNNQLVTSVNLAPANVPTANPILMKVIPNLQLNGRDTYGYTIPDGVHVLILDATGFDIVSSTISPAAAGTLCPQGLTFVSNDPSRTAQRVELDQGTLQPVNFFPSADSSQIYVATANNSSVLVYDFPTSTVTGIELAGNATPVSAGISIDNGTIAVSGSDGLLHQITTALGGSDQVQLTFPNIPNYLNPFCTFTPTTGPCTLNLALVRP